MILCSVAIPVFNRRVLVCKALESALKQNVKGLEILVVDNCSTDGTWEVLQTYQDSRLRLIRNDENVGLFGNFNRCLQLSRGIYLRFLCSDDKLTTGCLEYEMQIMDRHPDVAMLSTAGQFVNEAGMLGARLADQLPPGIYEGADGIHAWFEYFSRYGCNPLNYPSGVMFRRKVANNAGEFNASMRLAGDVDFYLRVLEHGNLAISNKVGCEILVHGQQEQLSANADGSGIREHLANLRRYRELLEKQGSYQRIRRQFTGVIMALIYDFWRKRNPVAVLKHKAILQEYGISWTEAISTFAKYYIFIRMLRLTGHSGVRPKPTKLL